MNLINSTTLSYILIIFLCADHCVGQQLIYKEFYTDTTHLTPLSIQNTLDENYLIVCNQYCFIPNGTVIEGCPISDQFIKIDKDQNVVYRTDLFNGRSYYNQEWTELPNGNLFVFSKAPENYSCGEINVALWGFNKFERYEMDKNGTDFLYHSYNDECDISPLSYLTVDQDTHLVFANSLESTHHIGNKLLTLNSNYEIVDSILYDNLYLSQLQLLGVNADSIYGIYISSNLATLNMIALDLISNNYNIREIGSIGLVGLNYQLGGFCTDIFGNGYASTSTYNSGNSAYEFKLTKFSYNGELLWRKDLPNDIPSRHIKIKNYGDKIATLTGYSNMSNGTVDARIQIIDQAGNEIERHEFEVDTTNIQPIDFIYDGSTVIIVGEVNKENNTFPSTPKRTFMLSALDINSLTETPVREKVSIFPNPITDILKIRLPENQKELSIQLFDYNGKNLMSLKTNEQEIDVSHLDNGIYFLKIACGSKDFGTHKLIKI